MRIKKIVLCLVSIAMLPLLPLVTFAEESNETINNNEVSQTIDSSITEEYYNQELEKALDAGYTEEQFKYIMEIPKLEDTELIEEPEIDGIVPFSASQQQAVVRKAREQLGKPYVWGAQGPNSFDCGGLVKYVYKQAVNMDLPMGTFNQERYGTEVSVNAMQPSDLMFYGARGNTTHVAIYIGNGQAIHAPQPGDVVRVFNVASYRPNFARRLLSGENDPSSYPNTIGMQQGEQYVWRLRNDGLGRHFYTTDIGEANHMINNGWTYEGVCWVAPTSGTPVIRMYNEGDKRHLYTPHESEIQFLVNNGWRREGVAFYAGGSKPVYRLFNPNVQGGQKGTSHIFTMNPSERDHLVSIGWRSEGTAFNGIRMYQ
ncbi:NlpC/P60 family protein [Enterococcus sp. AZ109]|uniref:NlpC/P60 family protein n=1 Tax=Enterococcus sp. AZ109 TaxID=2774634 RepID=UPI003F294C66